MNWKTLIILIGATFLFSSSKNIPVYTVADLTGKIEPAEHPEFVLVPSSYTSKTTYMRKAAFEAYAQMVSAARKDGINLTIVSGTRTHARQQEIWSEKWENIDGEPIEKAQKILTYSSMPGTSRHHWGTDIDLNSVESSYFDTPQGAAVYDWLQANAMRFGFFQPYIAKGDYRLLGYHEEKWHWSYFPIADQMLRAYKRIVTYNHITGFPGAEIAEEVGVIEEFVNGIPDLHQMHGGLFTTDQETP